MNFPYYKGDRKRQDENTPHTLPLSPLAKLNTPSGYIPNKRLRDAVNVSLLLGQPLLVTGEPGTGKTQLAYSIAWELGFNMETNPMIYETKSTSVARDLFYTYDTLSRFHAIQTKEGSQKGIDYITYNALGKAILLGNDPEKVAHVLPESMLHTKARRSVVLIDEVDKAPRDFPNDILNEIDQMFFRIPELGNAVIRVKQELKPIVIITSNSEKNLPDAFLRRCVYYDIPFPENEDLRSIITHRLGTAHKEANLLLDEALDFFGLLRDPVNRLRQTPCHRRATKLASSHGEHRRVHERTS